MVQKTKSSKRWLQEHHSDIYVKRAKEEGHRARSFYKLKEIVERYKFIKPGMTIIDLGAAPGSWSEYVKQVIGNNGKIFALDLLPITPIAGVKFIQGDFTEPEIRTQLENHIGSNHAVDLIISDMAPNISGLPDVDQARAIELAELVLDFADKTLKPNGAVLMKTFQGEGFPELLKKLRSKFSDVKSIKPQASRSRSKEVFLLAR